MIIERALVVDDEILMRRFLQETLERCGITVVSVQDGFQAIDVLSDEDDFDVVFTDIKMPKMSGIELLKRVKGQFKQTDVIVMTAYGTIETAVEAMKCGAFDYLLKPFAVDQIEIILKKLVERRELINENTYLKREINKNYNCGNMVVKSKSMANILDTVKKIAPTRATVLIQGETGTGKEIIARAIHSYSDRENKPFIKLNCAAVPENLMESELFGHEKGAFTGAANRRLGRFELANSGTLLLDEISEIPVHLQAKLLRVIQEREFERVGGHKTINVDVRIVATSNRDLINEVRNGNFREDLYYRLNVVPVCIDPLGDRPDDIEALCDFFIQKYCNENGTEPFKVDADTLQKMKNYSWPGNVRELENIVERSVVLGNKKILLPGDAPSYVIGSISMNKPTDICAAKSSGLKVGDSIREMEKQLIFKTLKANCWNKTRTAEMLEISIRTLRNKLHEYRDNNEIPEEFEILMAS